MIVDELTDILENREGGSAEFDRLVDEYRGHRDAAELIELLNSANDELVRLGAWILSEIRAAKYDNEVFNQRLRELTTHPSPAIRLHSLNAIYPLLSADSPQTIDLITRLRADDNEGVRMMAEAAARQLEATH